MFQQLVSSSSDMGGVARSTGNHYDLDGNRIRVVHPDTSFFTYDLDGLGRPTWIRENGGAPIVNFTYNSASQIVSRSASNDAYAWSGADNVVRPYGVNGLNQYMSASSAAFGYDPNGNLASVANPPPPGAPVAYVYDVEHWAGSAAPSRTGATAKSAKPS